MQQLLSIVFDRYFCLGELASGNATGEENVEFSVASALVLGKAEVGDNETEQSCSTPDVTAFAAHCHVSLAPRYHAR